ncbi:M28 family peptidase [Collinsella stercoris]|uniref:Peptidase M28 domain-containing protein n=1 Tax=Collinsella stercoris DSM 13279 TaxID=445975 RepID=B6GDP0_9ACTN|nr:M28 family peptidase [Collinsella stercoris]EEA89679.1 hypothetical protein COLSTE_02223 [Collinsella stercoris DSM 13279]UEA45153.1 M28 family peptidase [Collinsella stercoris DSM 13279]UWP12323.1 M28 family peptidase [Collinsella stercoris]
MANTKQYLSHLLQNTGIAPACSEEERAAADVIAKVFADHGFTPEMQEFSASGMHKVVQAGLGVAVFVGAVLLGLGGALGVVGLLLTLAAAVLFVLERSGKPILSGLGSGGLSQNVIAYHKASGPLASPRNRPVVVVAHYDTPREDLLAREPFAAYRPLIAKVLPFAMVAPAAIAIVRVFPVPGAARAVLWVLAIIVALVPLINGVAIIANRFVLPYTTGSVSNKSSVAAMLGVMDAVAPYELGDEFPHDTPADEYFAEQQRILDEAIAAAQAAAAAEVEAAMAYPHELEDGAADGGDSIEQGPAGPEAFTLVEDTSTDLPVADLGSTAMMPAVDANASAEPSAPAHEVVASEEGTDVHESADIASENQVAAFDPDATIAAMPAVAAESAVPAEGGHSDVAAATSSVDEPAAEEEAVQPMLDLGDAEPEPKLPFHLNGAGNVRFGADVIRGLGMLPESCAVVYETVVERVSEPASTPVSEPTPSPASEPRAQIVQDVDEGGQHPGDEAESLSEPVPEHDQQDVELSDDVQDDLNVPAIDDDAFGATDGFEATFEEEGDAFAYTPMTEDDFDGIMEAEYEIIEDDDSSEGGDGRTEVFEPSPVDAAAEPEGPVDVVAADDTASDDETSVDDNVSTFPFDGDAGAFDQLPFDAEAPAGSSYDEAPAVSVGSTVAFTPVTSTPAPEPADLSGTVAMPVPTQPVETVDSLMEQINSAIPERPQRTISVPSTADAPAPHVPQTANRASLFDLPDPSATPVDPFAAAPASSQDAPTDQDAVSRASEPASTVVDAPSPALGEGAFETIGAPAPVQEKPRRGIPKLFGRKKKSDDSMSDWLGVDESFDAKSSGSDIGSWDNFDDGWKGGAAAYGDATEEELREAVADMGDDELLGHDIWFVATGASENGNAGIRAFLDAHRSQLRGVFLINLESVGAGQLAMLATEGEQRVLKGDKRIMKLVQQVSADFHRECATVDMPYVTTDAHAAMDMSLRSLTIGGIEGTGFALSHTEEDQPYNVDTDNVAFVSDVVTEVIRRS